ncbi:MAG: hypothetical protein RJA61_376 [Candidatus Parcubacteria bacterium]|jgi:hypothetical protein
MKKNILIFLVIILVGIVVYFIQQKSDSNPTNENLVLSPVSAQGIQFMYPKVLPTTFIKAQEWPPVVEVVAGEFTCAENKKSTINGHVYCVTVSSEGAAGSTYTTYEYSTDQGDFVAKTTFTLRSPQCLNYDEPNQSTCIEEQENFDVSGLADQILTSVRMK